MLSFHVKFVQTDRRTDRGQMDNGKTICPLIFRYRGRVFPQLSIEGVTMTPFI